MCVCLWESVFPFHYVSPRDQTLVVRLCGKHFLPLSHLTGPFVTFKNHFTVRFLNGALRMSYKLGCCLSNLIVKAHHKGILWLLLHGVCRTCCSDPLTNLKYQNTSLPPYCSSGRMCPGAQGLRSLIGFLPANLSLFCLTLACLCRAQKQLVKETFSSAVITSLKWPPSFIARLSAKPIRSSTLRSPMSMSTYCTVHFSLSAFLLGLVLQFHR